MLTLTATWPDKSVEAGQPHSSYLLTMARGLAESFGLSIERIIEYLLDLDGVKQYMSAKSLLQILQDL